MVDATLTPRDRRALIVGAVVLGGLATGFRGLPAWRTWRADVGARVAAAVSAADRDAALLEAFPVILDSLEARLRPLRELEPQLLGGSGADEATSNLAALVTEFARKAPVRLDAVNVGADSSGSRRLPRVSATIRATADIAGLATLLREIEGGPTLLRIARLTVTPQNVTGSPDQIEQLSVQIEVEGVALVRQVGAAHATR